LEHSVARDLICFSHLRWNFVYQRPNHLMVRAARDRRVYFIEEPVFSTATTPGFARRSEAGVTIVTPNLPADLTAHDVSRALGRLLDDLVEVEAVNRPDLWYYTPMALPWSRHLRANATIYDSMDDLTGFRGAPPALAELEAELLARARVVFCGGVSLHARMRDRHPLTYCFPSSVDLEHFLRARSRVAEPADQAAIAAPRIGYAGVIDERIDFALVDGVAATRADWQIVLVGPLAKIRPEDVPARTNVHQLGLKAYGELPDYLAGWDVGWMPFARNPATRFISPTKTPEYLAAGLPVVSTSIHDVVESYGRKGLVDIADSVSETVRLMDRALRGDGPDKERVDRALRSSSWDQTWRDMDAIVQGLAPARADAPKPEQRAGTSTGRPAIPDERHNHVGVAHAKARVRANADRRGAPAAERGSR
jgi:UDP-galactopyranose mutase